MIRLLDSRGSAIYKALLEFRKGLKSGKLMIPSIVPQLLFICGGSTEVGPSFRRKKIIDFSQRNISNTFPFLAENVFEALKNTNRYQNLLQTEQTLFELADFIVIILESPSAFCELGAFSHYDKQRQKLIIINDINFKDVKSFINLGPLELITNENGEDCILWYSMKKKPELDRIADVYSPFKTIIEQKHRKNRKSVENLEFKIENKDDLLFLRDLISITGPVTESEIAKILEILFGIKYRDVQATLTAVLMSLNLLKYDRTKKTYFSPDNKFFYEYDISNLRKIISPFRSYSIKEKRMRF